MSKAEAGGEGEEEGPSPQLSAATQPAEAMDVVAQAPAVDDGESSVTTLAPSREPSYASTSSQPPQPSKRCRNMNVQLREQVLLVAVLHRGCRLGHLRPTSDRVECLHGRVSRRVDL